MLLQSLDLRQFVFSFGDYSPVNFFKGMGRYDDQFLFI